MVSIGCGSAALRGSIRGENDDIGPETSISGAFMVNHQERSVARPQEIPPVAWVAPEFPKLPGLGSGDLAIRHAR